MKRFARAWAVLGLALCAGCVSSTLGSGPKRSPVDISALQRKVDALLDYAAGVSDALPAELTVKTAAADSDEHDARNVSTLAADMRQHYGKIQELKTRGVLGEDNRGYLSMRNDDSFANAEEKNAAQKTMAAANGARKALYRMMAHASEEKGLTLTRVERVFAARRLARSAPGMLVQLPSNDQEYAAYGQSSLGQRLGAGAHPGDWVAIP